ncbi:MAG: hypothetical protein ACK4QL_06385 [Pseudanabaenaceae cyanobacterium]
MVKIKGYTSYFSSWGKRSKPWWRKWQVWLFLFLPLLLILTELTLRGGVWLFKGEEWLRQRDISIAAAYSLDDRHLQVKPHQLLGYTLLPQQTSKFWQINEQGWRSDPVNLSPDPQETRIFLLGNSTAFGYGSNSNQEMLGKDIENFLNQLVSQQREELAQRRREFNEFNPPPANLLRIKDTRFRVITTAIPGYASGNNLALLTYQVMAFRPAGLIFLEGYEDLRLPSAKTIATLIDTDALVSQPFSYLWQEFTLAIQNWWHSLYLVKFVRKLSGQPAIPAPPLSFYQTFYADQFASDPQEVQARVARLVYHWQQVRHISDRTGIPTLLVLQPELSTKNKLTPAEANIWQQLGDSYQQRLTLAYQFLEQVQPQLQVVNLRNLYQDFAETAFTDPIHLTAKGRQLLAQKIAQQIVSWFPHDRRKSE